MTKRHGFIFASVACALGLTLACSGKTDGGGAGAGSACDDYFQALSACPGELLGPSSDLPRLKGRFATLCADALALPGISITPTSLESCVSAIHSGGCSVAGNSGGPCSFATGSLAAGASCLSSGQCQSGSCSADSTAPDAGASACGSCGQALAVGQPCGSGQCPQGATCSGATPTPTCVEITYSGAGGSCNGVDKQCNPGLTCNGKGQCATPAGAGAPCQSGSDCASPLVCPAANGTSTCQSVGALGAPCASLGDCASGLQCDYTTQKCVTEKWASGGQPCDGTTRCAVGFCNPTGSSGTGTCPTVIADGQPCNKNDSTSTCDTFAACYAGTCMLGYPSCP